MKTALSKMNGFFYLAPVALCLGIGGCYSDIRDLCEEERKCQGGNDADEDACIEMMKGERKAAKEYGCKSEWKDYTECAAEHMSCEQGDFMVGEACDSKENKLWECVQKASDLYGGKG